MIGYLKGNVIWAEDGVVLLENNGVGYEITCSSAEYEKLLKDKKGEVYTYLAVRDDALSLFGFCSMEEKKMFLKLITVSGVGPKMGITVLSNMNLNDLAVMIATSDVKGLSKIKGLGKKTAERIILELREKISTENLTTDKKQKDQEEVELKGEDQDIVIGLMGLGYTRQDSIKALKKAKEQGLTKVQDLISYALNSFL